HTLFPHLDRNTCHSCTLILFFLLMLPPPPRSTLFSYTTLFRSNQPGKTCAGGTAAGSRSLPVSGLSWQRQKGPWHSTVDGCGDRTVPTDWGTGERHPMRQRFQG